MNNPIEFGTNVIDYSDLLSVKELILKKCEHIMEGLEAITDIESAFGSLDSATGHISQTKTVHM